MAKELVHDGDLFGIVSTGTSSIAIDLTYDRTRMEEAANKITGGGLKPSEIIQQSSTGETPQEVMHRANVAFETVYDMLNNLQQTQHRRKAVVLISNGYDFDPFASSRAGTADSVFLNNRNVDPNDPYNAHDEPGQSVQRRRAVDAARRADAAGEPRERHVLHVRPARPRGRAATSTSRSIRSSGNSICGNRRTAFACWRS